MCVYKQVEGFIFLVRIAYIDGKGWAQLSTQGLSRNTDISKEGLVSPVGAHVSRRLPHHLSPLAA